MTKQIKAYLAILEQFFSIEHENEELLKMRAELLQRIAFYQHERLVHLLVTLFFAVFFLISLALMLTIGGWGPITLTILFLGLLVPYIKHYYFLENSVQKMYRQFNSMNRSSIPENCINGVNKE